MRIKVGPGLGVVALGVTFTNAAPTATSLTTTQSYGIPEAQPCFQDPKDPNIFNSITSTSTRTVATTAATTGRPTGTAALSAFESYAANGYSACSVLPTSNTDDVRSYFTKPLGEEPTVMVERMYCDGEGWCFNPGERPGRWREKRRFGGIGRVECEGDEEEEEDGEIEERYGYPTGSFTWEESYPNVWKTKTKKGSSTTAAPSTTSFIPTSESSSHHSASLQPRWGPWRLRKFNEGKQKWEKQKDRKYDGWKQKISRTMDFLKPPHYSSPTKYLRSPSRRDNITLTTNLTLPDFPVPDRRGDNGCVYADDDKFWAAWKVWSMENGVSKREQDERMWEMVCKDEVTRVIRGMPPWTEINPGTVTFKPLSLVPTTTTTSWVRFSEARATSKWFPTWPSTVTTWGYTTEKTTSPSAAAQKSSSTVRVTEFLTATSSAAKSQSQETTTMEVPEKTDFPLPSLPGPEGCLFVDDAEYWKQKEEFDRLNVIEAVIPRLCLNEKGQIIKGFPPPYTYIWGATSSPSPTTSTTKRPYMDKAPIYSTTQTWEYHDRPVPAALGPNGCVYKDDHVYFSGMNSWNKGHGITFADEDWNLCKDGEGNVIEGLPESVTSGRTSSEGYVTKYMSAPTERAAMQRRDRILPQSFVGVPEPKVRGPKGCVYKDDEEYFNARKAWEIRYPSWLESREEPIICRGEEGGILWGLPPNTWEEVRLTTTRPEPPPVEVDEEEAPKKTLSRRQGAPYPEPRPEPVARGPKGCIYADDKEYIRDKMAWDEKFGFWCDWCYWKQRCRGENGGLLRGFPPNTWEEMPSSLSRMATRTLSRTTSASTTSSTSTTTPAASLPSILEPPGRRGPDGCFYHDDPELLEASILKGIPASVRPLKVCKNEDGTPASMPINITDSTTTKITSSTSTPLSGASSAAIGRVPGSRGRTGCTYWDDPESLEAFVKGRIPAYADPVHICRDENGLPMKMPSSSTSMESAPTTTSLTSTTPLDAAVSTKILPREAWDGGRDRLVMEAWMKARAETSKESTSDAPPGITSPTSATASVAISQAKFLSRDGPSEPRFGSPEGIEESMSLKGWQICTRPKPGASRNRTAGTLQTMTSPVSTSAAAASLPTQIVPRGELGPNGCIYADDKERLDRHFAWAKANGFACAYPLVCPEKRPTNSTSTVPSTTSTPSLSRRQVFVPHVNTSTTTHIPAFVTAPLFNVPTQSLFGPGGCRYADDRRYWQILTNYLRFLGVEVDEITDICTDEKGKVIYGLPPHTSTGFHIEGLMNPTLTTSKTSSGGITVPASSIPTTTTTTSEVSFPQFSSRSVDSNEELPKLAGQRVHQGLPSRTSGFETQTRGPASSTITSTSTSTSDSISDLHARGILPPLTCSQHPANRFLDAIDPKNWFSAKDRWFWNHRTGGPGHTRYTSGNVVTTEFRQTTTITRTCFGDRCMVPPWRDPAVVHMWNYVDAMYAYAATRSLSLESVHSMISEEKEWGHMGNPSLAMITPPPTSPTNDFFFGVATNADEDLILTYVDVCAQIYTLKESLSAPNVNTTSLLARESHLRSSSSILLSQLRSPGGDHTSTSIPWVQEIEDEEAITSALHVAEITPKPEVYTEPYWYLETETPTTKGGLYGGENDDLAWKAWDAYYRALHEMYRTDTWRLGQVIGTASRYNPVSGWVLGRVTQTLKRKGKREEYEATATSTVMATVTATLTATPAA